MDNLSFLAYIGIIRDTFLQDDMPFDENTIGYLAIYGKEIIIEELTKDIDSPGAEKLIRATINSASAWNPGNSFNNSAENLY